MRNLNQKGITIIEVLIVIFVICLLIAITLPQFSKIRENQVFKGAVQDTISAIEKAKSKTMASVDSSEYGVQFESDQVIIFKGTTFSAGDPDNEIISIISPASITNVTLGGVSGASGNLYFNRLSGTPSKTGTITITAGSNSKLVTIGAAGSVSSN